MGGNFSNFQFTSLNVTALTAGGSGNHEFRFCSFISDTASAASISSSCNLYDCVIYSTNTNAITGAGTLNYCNLTFTGSSSTINTTTQTLLNQGPSAIFGSANSGGTNTITATNTSNTASSNASIVASVGGTSAADAFYKASVSGTTDWTWGVDNSDSDAWVLSASGTPGTTNVMRSAITGEINFPLQSAFLAYNSVDDTNATGAGTVFTVIFDTEIYDQNSDFDGTSTFTAPVTGRYHFNYTLRYEVLTAAMTYHQIQLVTSNRTYRDGVMNVGAVKASGDELSVSIATYADMDAGDTAQIQATISNGAGNTATVSGSAGTLTTYFGGKLTC
jgi:hypothetical protein